MFQPCLRTFELNRRERRRIPAKNNGLRDKRAQRYIAKEKRINGAYLMKRYVGV